MFWGRRLKKSSTFLVKKSAPPDKILATPMITRQLAPAYEMSAKSNNPRVSYCDLTISNLSAVHHPWFDRKWILSILRPMGPTIRPHIKSEWFYGIIVSVCLLYYIFSFFFSIFISIIILCLLFMANKSVHLSLQNCAIPERLRGVFTMRRYTLPLP